MATPPLRTEISDTYPNPSDAVARIGFGRLYDYVVGLLGSTGNSVEARAALGAAKAGVNSDLTSISTITGMGNGNVTQIQVTATGGVGINTVPDTSAIFDIQSTTKGFKIPKMTNAQKIAIANTEALIVYDTTLKTVSVNNGVVWGSVGGGASGGGLDNVAYENDVFVTANHTIGANAMQPCTISNATPAVITQTNSYVAGQPIRFESTGVLPTGITGTDLYYVIATGLSTTTFRVSISSGGVAINTSTAGSGTHTAGKLKNAETAGPILINDSVTFTVPTGSTWSII